MYRHAATAAPEQQRNLKQNFELALMEIREDDPRAIAHRKPIVERKRKTAGDTKKQALSMAASALATLWGL